MMSRQGAVIAPPMIHIAIQSGINKRYGECFRKRQESTRGWMASQNDGIVGDDAGQPRHGAEKYQHVADYSGVIGPRLQGAVRLGSQIGFMAK
jgi:hypothetical protein